MSVRVVAESPLVSVLVPVHNGARYLAEALASVAAQTYPTWECVVVLDSCTDESELIARSEIPPERLRIVKITHRRVGSALMAGLRCAEGTYVARLDADDKMLPDRLVRQVAEMEARPSLAVLGSAATVIDGHGNPVGTRAPLSGVDELKAALLRKNQFIHPSVLMRRSSVIEQGGYRTDLPKVEDYDLWLRVAVENDLDNLAESLTAYRVHPEQETHRGVISWHAARTVGRSRSQLARSLGHSVLVTEVLNILWWARNSRLGWWIRRN
ncbi:MAG: glycosyltransferase [Acidimicrobiia bacterium]